MMSGSSMYKTKLCNLFKKTGNCSRPNCSFAHGTVELRRPGDSSFPGRRHNMDSDLRDRLGRQFSPERRPSLDRSGRRLQRFSGHENARPFEFRRDKDYRENHRFDERRDYAGGLKVGNRIEGRAEDGRSKFQGYNNVEDGRNKFQGYSNVLEEQLKDVEMDVKTLTDDKLRLEASVERKAHEVDILTSRIEELETQLDREKEECRRITSSTKKFVKEYNRFLRAQDDLKRSEARLQKLGNQLSTYLAESEGINRDVNVDIVSDEENNGRNLRTVCDPQNELQNMPRKKRYVDQYTTKETVEDGFIGRGEEEKMEKEKEKKRPSRWNMGSSKSYSKEESGAWNDEDTINKSSSKEDNWKRRRFSIGTSSTDKVISSTSMAAQAFDDVAEFEEDNPEAAKSSPLISLPPPPPFRETHVQVNGDEDDENVDVMEQGKANDLDDSI
ncbi:PREDICTED: zinc finger CCCH domain-containing protein 40-like isoform X1 [Camelina sativa]|uniref:Zinc finger CCCH domain-containing protein 40-like isoform X1 n=2 Tax=Camelina sativa TaxID=90675 RepID=A0ABM0Z5E0_CAMSA|nr:PREDICTED: zinc finger CCCH domain-containing protein 40-like isoform X1 [Camelina sativa]XP_010510671.1 PREDICTED: zinc finger CCCH domain-containing protein 40-like isoform X1 [Camelina sativa]